MARPLPPQSERLAEATRLLNKMRDLLAEREAAVRYSHYVQAGHYRPGTFLRHPNRRGTLTIATCIACPVRYTDDLQPTHVLVWVPHTATCRWLDLKSGRINLTDVTDIPEDFH